ncbi:hypothetical protein Fuma_04244 [Fuerstiella marisgermanici]|uniref:Uncharacterized protein n=1 Tax=Fuerstiella marisgermanici TaxID=1891926 RepID=A0A1P8WKP8_9PLAN|nr:hypothetical protein Fuma_04244 [Fuerstiella marisgermanici]
MILLITEFHGTEITSLESPRVGCEPRKPSRCLGLIGPITVIIPQGVSGPLPNSSLPPPHSPEHSLANTNDADSAGCKCR